jgi:hypothetical protein
VVVVVPDRTASLSNFVLLQIGKSERRLEKDVRRIVIKASLWLR